MDCRGGGVRERRDGGVTDLRGGGVNDDRGAAIVAAKPAWSAPLRRPRCSGEVIRSGGIGTAVDIAGDGGTWWCCG